MRDLDHKTVIAERYYIGGKYQAHWDANNKEIVVLDCWYEDAGEGDVMPDFLEVAVYNSVAEFEQNNFNLQLC